MQMTRKWRDQRYKTKREWEGGTDVSYSFTMSLGRSCWHVYLFPGLLENMMEFRQGSITVRYLCLCFRPQEICPHISRTPQQFNA